MEGNFKQLNTKQRANYQTLQDDRHPGYNLNAEERGLDVHVRQNIGFQPLKGKLTATTISGIPDTRNQLYMSGDATWDQYCAIYIRENDTTKSEESEKEMRNANIELYR
ncbi:MAG: hypothetical protein EZS28_031226 [Streblomastix strix]|uniref:Uncharacterized protein n=1 Tax=Streblomastix strix TaxID=222440 RepID=A0A5J4US67_9EUKA|nr:MAG: hypothetical protein EZS28_031226 [Streblomastix strix]